MKKVIVIINVLLAFLLLSANVVKADIANVSTFEELTTAITNGSEEINISNDIEFDSSLTISNNIKINGNGKKISRKSGYTGGLFNITAAGTLEINDITIDSGAEGWRMD